MTGQAMGGIFPALVDIIVKALDVDEKNTGVACFLTATAFLVVCVVGFALVRRTPFFQFYANALTSPSSDLRSVTPPSPVASRSIIEIVMKSWHFCLSIFIVFSTTLAVFPAITVLIESGKTLRNRTESLHNIQIIWTILFDFTRRFYSSEHRNVPHPSAWAKKYFTTVTCFLLFNSCDYLGRLMASWLLVPSRSFSGRITILLLSLARITFIPIFMFCNAAPTKRTLPIYFRSDLSFIFFMTIFALSNGYLGNLCMIHGPKSFVLGADQELCAMVLVAFLVVGTSCGSFISYPLVNLI
jgi:equilibrative nucleoside transporter 1/2/3